MLNKTNRYKFNKLISSTPAENIQYALDVNSRNLTRLQTELKKITATDSFTLIVISNKSQKGIL